MKLNFKTKIMLLCNIPLFFLGITISIMTHYSIEGQKVHLENSFIQYAHALSDSIGDQFYERYGDVQAFAVNSTVHSLDAQKIPEVLNQYVSLYGIYDLILVIDKKGKLISANTFDTSRRSVDLKYLKDYDFSKELWFIKTVNKETLNDKAKGFAGTYVNDPDFLNWTEPVLGNKLYANIFSTAITTASGEVRGVVANVANFKWMEQTYQRLYDNLSQVGHPSTELTLLNKDGLVLIDFDPVLRNGDKTIVHDESVLKKRNLLEDKVEAAIDLHMGKSGVDYSIHSRKKIQQLTAFSPVISEKFPSELGWQILVRNDPREVAAAANKTKYSVWFMIGCILLLFGGVAYFISRKYANILEDSSRQLIDTAHQLRESADKLASNAEELASASQESAASIEEISATVEELNATAKSTSGLTIEAKSMVESSENVVEGGLQSSASLEVAMGEIASSSKQIIQISDMIDEIAFQTNLLALNAAVEAARAGEQGKGFAVVADAVRTLAGRSASAAKDIGQILQTSTSKIEHGVGVANDTRANLNSIGASFSKLKDVNFTITTASHEQVTGIDQISISIQALDTAIQQNSATSEDSALAAQKLSQLSNHLGELAKNLETVLKGA